MPVVPVIMVFDVGKTNKKVLLLDENYKPVYEDSRNIAETMDEDGFPCDDIDAITDWLRTSCKKIFTDQRFSVRAINFSAYGASFVYLDQAGKVLTPLYNYLKPFPEALSKQFYAAHGGEEKLSLETASPVLGSLNSALQLYRMKYQRPEIFQTTRYALHLPQYLSYLLTGQAVSDITSVGCHTHLWNYGDNRYHDWVSQEKMEEKLAPLQPSSSTFLMPNDGRQIHVGIGLHDSSAALIPYLVSLTEPFILLSTGTWCIGLNPFNQSPLTNFELQQDCLCYLTHEGKQVKASRLFAGYEHEQQVKKLAAHFNVAEDYYKTVQFDTALSASVSPKPATNQPTPAIGINPSAFQSRDLSRFKDYSTAYHQLIMDIMAQQSYAVELIIDKSNIRKVFVDGGFGNNPVFMHLLAGSFPGLEVYAARVTQASAMGAALAIHHQWNNRSISAGLIELRHYPAGADNSIVR